jgi:hypothetical protein
MKPIKELAQEAHNYEYSPTVSARVYIRTAATLLKHVSL